MKMQVRKNLEKFIQYILLSGFLLIGVGVIISILRSGMPVELNMIVVGIALIVMAYVMAKLFGEVLDGRHKMG
jgi:flagellar biosynthesis protein FliP